MTTKESYEFSDNSDSPLVSFISDCYSEAYQHQLRGESPIGVSVGLGGPMETLGLNPRIDATVRDNLRFLICAGGIIFGGFSLTIGDKKIDPEYCIIKITLAPEDIRQIEELKEDDLSLVAAILVDDEGRVANGINLDWLTDEETSDLITSLKACELAPEVPNWAQQSVF